MSINTSGYNEEKTAEVAKRGIEIQVKEDAEERVKSVNRKIKGYELD